MAYFAKHHPKCVKRTRFAFTPYGYIVFFVGFPSEVIMKQSKHYVAPFKTIVPELRRIYMYTVITIFYKLNKALAIR